NVREAHTSRYYVVEERLATYFSWLLLSHSFQSSISSKVMNGSLEIVFNSLATRLASLLNCSRSAFVAGDRLSLGEMSTRGVDDAVISNGLRPLIDLFGRTLSSLLVEGAGSITWLEVNGGSLISFVLARCGELSSIINSATLHVGRGSISISRAAFFECQTI